MKTLLTAAVILVGVAVTGWKYWDDVVNPWTRNGQVMAQVIQITPRSLPSRVWRRNDRSVEKSANNRRRLPCNVRTKT